MHKGDNKDNNNNNNNNNNKWFGRVPVVEGTQRLILYQPLMIRVEH